MKMDHIGVAVDSLEEALKFYRDTLGLEPSGVRDVPAEKVRVVMLPVGGARIELLEGTAEDSTIAQFIRKRGQGIHHLSVHVENLDRHLERLRAAGARVLPGKGERGAGGQRYAFVHPASTGGVLLELVEELEAEKEPR